MGNWESINNEFIPFYNSPVIIVNPKYVFARVNNITVYIGGSGFLVCSCAEFSNNNGTCNHVRSGSQLYSFDYSFSSTNGAGMFITRKKDGRKWFVVLDKLQPDEAILDTIDDLYTFINSLIPSSAEEMRTTNSNAATIIDRGNAIETSINNYKKSRNIDFKMKE